MIAYFIIADHGNLGRETIINWEDCSRERVILDIMRGEVDRPIEVHCIDTEDKSWADVSEDIAQEIMDRVRDSDDYPVGGCLDYCESHLGCLKMARIAAELGIAA